MPTIVVEVSSILNEQNNNEDKPVCVKYSYF